MPPGGHTIWQAQDRIGGVAGDALFLHVDGPLAFIRWRAEPCRDR
jgi:hypothetical protein